MRFSLRKGSSHIHVTFKDEDYSNKIAGDNFEIECENSVNRIHVNIESNLTQRNKLSNSYSDTLELIRKAEQINFIQIDESQVVDGLIKTGKKYPKNSWELFLHAGNGKSFKYNVKPSLKFGSVFLFVIDL